MSRKGRSSSRTASSVAQSSAQLSAAQLAANRANAQKSTGPRTAEGKARSSQNALKHGLFSKALQQSFKGRKGPEDQARYDELLASYRKTFAPEDETEEEIVDRLASQWWRLGRLNDERERFCLERLASSLNWGTAEIAKMVSPIAVEEGRTHNSWSKHLRDLEFLQRWRVRQRGQPVSTRPVETEAPTVLVADPSPPAEPPLAAASEPAPLDASEFIDPKSMIPYENPGRIDMIPVPGSPEHLEQQRIARIYSEQSRRLHNLWRLKEGSESDPD